MHDLAHYDLSVMELIEIAMTSDRFSITDAHAYQSQDSRLHAIQSMYSVNNEAISPHGIDGHLITDSPSRKKKYFLLHNRDTGYKLQPDVVYRNSSIDKLIQSLSENTCLHNMKLIRIGKGGELPTNHLLNQLHVDSNNGQLLHEPTVLKHASLFLATTSGCGVFASMMYGVPTILLNTTIIHYADIFTYGSIIALKYLSINDLTVTKYKTPVDIVCALCEPWSNLDLDYRELSPAEIYQVVSESMNSTTVFKTLADVHPAFRIVLKNFSRHRISTITYLNLRSIFDCF